MTSIDTVDAYTDVVELCALLQCLGFNVKSLDSGDGNLSQDGGVKTVTINCQSSGLNVVLESVTAACSCPVNNNQNSSFWQVSAVSGGKQHDKKFGSALLGGLPSLFRDQITRELRSIVKGIKENNETGAEKLDASGRSASKLNLSGPATANQRNLSSGLANKSASMVEMKTTPPEKNLVQLKADTPTRYRSLDTLTAVKDGDGELPPPGNLVKQFLESDTSIEDLQLKKRMCHRQSTYTVTSHPELLRRRNKTSSPIQTPQNTILDSLLVAEKAAAELRDKIAAIISECTEGKHLDESSMSALDVSKISLLKGAEPKTQFVSSPNLSSLRTVQEDAASNNNLRRFSRASTSSLSSSKLAPKESKISKLRRLSPNFFKLKKDSPSANADKSGKDSKTLRSASSGIVKPRIVTPVRLTPRTTAEGSQNLSGSKKKYSHIKSTIPRYSPLRKE